MVKNGIHDRVNAIFYIINMAEQNNVEFVLRRKFCLLFFYIFLFIFRFAGQMHAELFEDALIYRGKQDGGMNLASFKSGTAFRARAASGLVAALMESAIRISSV